MEIWRHVCQGETRSLVTRFFFWCFSLSKKLQAHMFYLFPFQHTKFRRPTDWPRERKAYKRPAAINLLGVVNPLHLPFSSIFSPYFWERERDFWTDPKWGFNSLVGSFIDPITCRLTGQFPELQVWLRVKPNLTNNMIQGHDTPRYSCLYLKVLTFVDMKHWTLAEEVCVWGGGGSMESCITLCGFILNLLLIEWERI